MGGQLLGLGVLDLGKSQVFWANSVETCNWTLSLSMNGFIILIYPKIKWCCEMGMTIHS